MPQTKRHLGSDRAELPFAPPELLASWRRRICVLALAAGVLGVAAFALFTLSTLALLSGGVLAAEPYVRLAALPAIAALFLAGAAERRITRSAGLMRGRWIARSGAGLSAIVVLGALLAGYTSPLRPTPLTVEARQRLVTLVDATLDYTRTNGGRFPVGNDWPHLIEPYLGLYLAVGDQSVEALWSSPADPEAGRAYALNAALAGRALSEVKDPSRTVLLFEVRPGSPAVGGREMLPSKPSVGWSYHFGFVDGSVGAADADELDELVWTIEEPE